ncbi:MAG: hypothetical protein KY429_10805, partial [Actinobacteria bacterium]|nr:hypothetical protein [Actinomycetota bacterium]
QAQLTRGERLTELLKQPQFSPVPVEKQVVTIYAGTNGYFDDVAVVDVKRFEKEMQEYVESRSPDIYDHIRGQGDLPEEIEKKLRKSIEDFKQTFVPSEDVAAAESGTPLRVESREDAVTDEQREDAQ